MLRRNFYTFYLFIIFNLIIFAQADRYRLPENVIPKSYKLFLNPDITAKVGTFNGNVSIRIDVLSTTNNITLHASNLIVDIAHTTLKNGIDEFLPISQRMVLSTEFLIINFIDDLLPGVYELNLKFKGYIHDHQLYGLFRSSYTNERDLKIFYALTHFEPTFARQVFPCWDEPAFKAKFEINIQHFPNYTALSNMPVLERMNNLTEEGKIWTKFKKTPLLSTYTLAFAISDFKNVTNKFGNYTVWASRTVPDKSIEYGFNVGLKAFNAMETDFGIPYSLPKIDIFLALEFEVNGMENYGLIIIKQRSFLTYNTTRQEILDKVGRIVCHEIIHQWIGNLVSPAWWSDVWITEGLPSYFESSINRKISVDGSSNALSQSLYSNMWKSFNEEDLLTDLPIYRNISDASNVFDSVTQLYMKSPVIINMLSNILTKQVLHRAVKNMVKNFQYQTITMDQFLELIQQSIDISIFPEMYGEFDVKAFLMPYLTQVGYPVINVIRNNETKRVKLTQECVVCKDKNSTNLKWTVPITFTTQSSLNFQLQQTINFLLPSNRELIIKVKPKDWVILNIQSIGYYRVNYDNVTWQQISDYMNSEKFTNIHVRNRLKLLEDARFFTIKGIMSIQTFCNFLSYVKRERDLFIWRNLMDIILSIVLYTDHNILDIYKNLVRIALKNVKHDIDTYDVIKGASNVLFLEYCLTKQDLCRNIFCKFKRH
ncbi:aminopeptidase Q-like [Leptopilina heterotoma]|uniref:aminopeptidase Q-like n=1 Tax=Leptopilina heterotoma TaxID=63436 RepID=UPI001CA95BD5|nr:aminopeptidase Q-like [Leptopilina heterotoma]